MTIGDSVTSIGIRAFESCSAVQNVTVSANVIEIRDGTFSSCTNLRLLFLRSKRCNFSPIYNQNSDFILYLPSNAGSIDGLRGVICDEDSKSCTCEAGYGDSVNTNYQGYFSCVQCSSGSYNEGYSRNCVKCVAGKFMSLHVKGASSESTCEKCPAGTYQFLSGSSTCTPCNPGS